MTLALGLLGYAFVIIAAGLVAPWLGIGAAGAVCLFLAYANQPPRRP